MHTRFLNRGEIYHIDDIVRCGVNCTIARSATFDGEIRIGDNTLISDNAIITGNVTIGDYCHIVHGVQLHGKHGIDIGNHCVVGADTKIYTESDDWKGYGLIGPQYPDRLRRCYSGTVVLRDFAGIAADCIVMPNTTMLEGSMLQLRSNLIRGTLDKWCEYASKTPQSNAEFIRTRPDKQKQLINEL